MGNGMRCGGLGVILVLRSAYMVYDLTNNYIAIAQAVLNALPTSNIVEIPSGTSIPGVSSTARPMVPMSVVANILAGSCHSRWAHSQHL
jgi:hypothetical protein